MTRPVNSFRYCNSSPEVTRLVVMMYVKPPLSRRGGSAVRARGRHLPRDGTDVVEPVRADVRVGDDWVAKTSRIRVAQSRVEAGACRAYGGLCSRSGGISSTMVSPA